LYFEVQNSYPSSADASWLTPDFYNPALLSKGIDFGSPYGYGDFIEGIGNQSTWGWDYGPQYATGMMQGQTVSADGPGGGDLFIPVPNGVLGAARHSNGSNFAFADGHAKWLPSSDVSSGVATPLALASQGVACGTPGHGSDDSFSAPVEDLGNSSLNGVNGNCGALQATFDFN
jgi:prepilin-type processing-associated H-X9-DG protein